MAERTFGVRAADDEVWFPKCLYSLSGQTSYHKISLSLEAARSGYRPFQLLLNLTSTSTAALPRCLSNVRERRSLWHPISRLRDLTRFVGNMSYRLVNRGPGWDHKHTWEKDQHLARCKYRWMFCIIIPPLIHPPHPWTKWPPFWQTTLSNTFSWMKMIEFWVS